MTAAETAKQTTKQIETLAADAQKNVGEQMEKFAKSFEGLAAFNQESVDAVLAASNVAVKAAEEINAEVMSFSKKAMEDSIAAAKDVAAAKSVMEAVEKQSEFAKASFDSFIKQAAKMNEMAMAAAKSAMEPIAALATAAGDMVKTFQS